MMTTEARLIMNSEQIPIMAQKNMRAVSQPAASSYAYIKFVQPDIVIVVKTSTIAAPTLSKFA